MASLAKRPRRSDDYDPAPVAPTAVASGGYYDNVPGTSMTRSTLAPQPSGSASAMLAPGTSYSSHLWAYPATSVAPNGINGTSAALAATSPHLSSSRSLSAAPAVGGAPAAQPLSSDDDDMAPPKGGSLTTTSTRARGRGRGRGRPRGRGRGRGASTSTTVVHKPDLEESDSEEPPNPLVFQCRCCFRLLGDSLAFVATDIDLGYVILSDVSEIIQQDTTYETSTEPGKDIGSTFARLRCAGCNAAVGRNYRTTPRDLDDLRDCFSLEVDAIYTYQLGSNYTRQKEEDDEDQDALVDGGASGKPARASRPTHETVQAEDTKVLITKMERTRALTIELSDRLIKAEEEIRRYSALVDKLMQSEQIASKALRIEANPKTSLAADSATIPPLSRQEQIQTDPPQQLDPRGKEPSSPSSKDDPPASPQPIKLDSDLSQSSSLREASKEIRSKPSAPGTSTRTTRRSR